MGGCDIFWVGDGEGVTFFWTGVDRCDISWWVWVGVTFFWAVVGVIFSGWIWVGVTFFWVGVGGCNIFWVVVGGCDIFLGGCGCV